MHGRTLLVCLLAGIALLTVPAAALADRQVALRPAAGAAGTTVVLQGSGFPASKRVRVTLAGTPTRFVTSSRDGAFRARLTVPAGRRGWVQIVSRSGRGSVVSTFFATGRPGADQIVEVATAAGGRVRVSPLSVVPGAAVRLQGSGFPAGRRLIISWAGTMRKLRAGRKGRFATDITAPDAPLGGSWRVAVAGAGVRHVFQLGLRVLPGGVPVGGAGAPGSGAPPGPAVAPSNTGSPGIAGPAQKGQTLTADPGAWEGTAPLAFAYEWQRCNPSATTCAAIPGATSAGYLVTGTDVDRVLRVVVTASNAAGAATATSKPTAVVVAAPENTALPKVSGTARDGQTLKTTVGTWTGDKPISYAYQWQRCDASGGGCAAIAGATGSSYGVSAGDVGSTLRAAVTATDSSGSTTAASDPTTVVLPAPPPGAVAALWHMDETSGGVMYDSVGGHDGTLHSVQLGQAGFANTGYGFSGSGYVSVPSDAGLNPGAADVTITIHMQTTKLPPPEDWDLIRKGLASDGAEFKVEYYPSGQASCGFIGTSGHVELKAGPALNDGQWHTIQCVKTASAIKTVVDGQTFSKSGSVGSISNGVAVAIGARPGSEFFQGTLDEASIQIG